MMKKVIQLKVVIKIALVVLLFLCLGCATMEEKRDRFMAQGKEAYEKGDYVTARLHFQNAVQIDPKFAEAYLWVGKANLKEQNFRGAFGNLSKAVELKPELDEAQVLLAQMLMAAKKLDEASEKINLVLKRDPKNIEALLVAASMQLAKQQPTKALEYLGEVRRLDPGKTAAYLMQSLIEAQQKQYAAADATLEEGLKVSPKSLDLYITRARLAEARKDFDKGEEILLQALQVAPNELRLQDEFARLYAMAGQWDKAEQALRQKLQQEPDKDQHAVALARFLAGRRKQKEAENVLKEFMEKHPDNYPIRFALADFYLAERRVGRSEKVLTGIIASDPSGPKGMEAKGKLAAVRLAQGQREEAAKLAAEILKTNAKDMMALRIQGLIALAKKDGLTAINNFRVLSQDQPENAEYLLLLAQAHLLNNEPEQAKGSVKKALTLKPDYQEARRFLYDLYLKNKDYNGAIELAKEYLRVDDKDLVNLSYLGDFYVLKGDDKQARATFQKMIEIDPQDPQGYLKQALLSRKLKQPQAAIKYLEEILAKKPDYLPALQLLAGIYQEQQQPEKVLQAARQTLALSPKNPQLHYFLGGILLAQNQPQSAVAALEESLSLNPANSQAARLLVLAYNRLPDKQATLKQLEERVADPKTPLFYSLVLAMMYEQEKAVDDALRIYEQLLTRATYPILLVVRNNLAYLLAEYRPSPEDLEKAAKLAKENIDDNPDDPRLQDTMGWILCKQGNYAKAKDLLEDAVTKEPEQPTLLYHLGWCAAKLGDTGIARVNLEKALSGKDAFPERAEAEKLLSSLPGESKPQ